MPHPHKRFYDLRGNIPRVKGKRRLDIGWVEGETPWPGSTLGLDPPGIWPPYSQRPEDLEYHKEHMYGREPVLPDPDLFKEIQGGIKQGEIEPSFEHVYGTGTDLPFATGSIDAIHSGNALGLNYDTFGGLEEAIRVLRSGGKLFVRFPMDSFYAKEIRNWLQEEPQASQITKASVTTETSSKDIDIDPETGERVTSYTYYIRFTKL
tara:strand:- start:232 stop:852 length:621 start_codon:yes stop_codon:yes gene_type:complete